jgi:hypothetical protein
MAAGFLLRQQKDEPREMVQAATPHTPGAGAMTPAPDPRSNPADMLGARGSLMAFTTATIVGGLSAEHVRAAIRTSLPSASENSGTVACDGNAGALPCNLFDV